MPWFAPLVGMLRRQEIQVNALFPNPRVARNCKIRAPQNLPHFGTEILEPGAPRSVFWYVGLGSEFSFMHPHRFG